MRTMPLLLLPLAGLLLPAALAGQPTKRPSDEERGKELWVRHCTSCHGTTNRGDGPATAALVVPVPDLAGRVKPDKPTIQLVLNGKGGMPAFEATLEFDDAKRVLQHMAVADQPPSADPKAPTREPAPPADGEAPGDAQGEGPDPG